MEHEYIYGRKMPIEMLIRQVADSKKEKGELFGRGTLLHIDIPAPSLWSWIARSWSRRAFCVTE